MEKLLFIADDSIEFVKCLDFLSNSFFKEDDVFINAAANEYIVIFDVRDSNDANSLEKELTMLFGKYDINGFFELN